MRDLSIRKIPGIGRVNERLLESIGIKVCLTGLATKRHHILTSSDMW
jgi:hypothetical protein